MMSAEAVGWRGVAMRSGKAGIVVCAHCKHEQPGRGPLLCPRCGYIMKDKPAPARPVRGPVIEENKDGD